MDLGITQKSSWTDYPHLYKFMSIHFYVNPNVKTIERQTYDFLSLLGDIGGLIEILFYSLRLFLLPFSAIQMRALLTNRLYHIAQGTHETHKGLMDNVPNSNLQISIPPYLDLAYLRYKFACCMASERFRKFKKVLHHAHISTSMDLDVVRLVRRLRMHGFALHFLLDK